MFELFCWCVGIFVIGPRIYEEMCRAKTIRRMNDLSNMYWDYNHKCWVTKIEQPIAEVQQEIVK